MQPLSDRILVLPDAPKEISSGGILLTAVDEKPKTQGVIVAVGPKVRDITVGNHIIHERMDAYDPGKVELDGVLHYLMREKDVIAIIED